MIKFNFQYFLFSTLFLCFSSFGIAQVEDDPDADEDNLSDLIVYNKNEYKGFFVGANFGVHFANKSTATFYTGNPFFTPNDICIFLPCPILGSAGNDQVYNQLVQEIGNHQFTLESFGDDLRYEPALTLGLNLRYRLGPFSSIQTDITYANLKANGVIVFNVDRPNPNGTADDFFESHPIWGKEQRLVFSPGFQFNLSDPGDFVPYFDVGGILTSTRVIENRFRVGNREFSILRPQILNGQVVNRRQQTSNALGAYAGLGVNLEFDKVILDFGYRASFEKVPFRNLDEELSVHDNRTLHHSITLKFIYAR